MTTLTWQGVVDADELAARRRQRDDIVGERAMGDDRFVGVDGPFERWERTLDVTPLADGRFGVAERIDYRLAVPYWRPLLALPVRMGLRRPRPDGRQPWWAPADRLDPRSASVLSSLAVLAVVAGYLGTLVGQTMTFAADEFGASDQAQGVALATVRIGVLVALGLSVVADRRGRRLVVVGAAAAGIVVAASGALVPSLAWLTGSQVLGRSFATTLGIVVPIVAAEEMPSGSRAWALSVLALCGSLGAGVAVGCLPLADLGDRTWRLVYLVPLLALPVVVDLARRLPESRRFERHRAAAGAAGRLRDHRRRFTLLAVTAFLVALMVAPAAQFRNEFLTDERGFSALGITLFVYATNTPAGVGVLVGGWLADRRGRRLVGGVALSLGAAGTGVAFLASGPSLWVASLAASIVGAMAIPALQVYGPELFPTGLRGRANGALSAVGVTGSAIGLLTAGALSSRLGGLGVAIAVLAVGPVLAGLLIVVAYPETARRELEDINPGDAVGAAPEPSRPPPPPPRPPSSGRPGRDASRPPGGG